MSRLWLALSLMLLTSLSFAQQINGTPQNVTAPPPYMAASGSVNVMTACPTPAISVLVAGQTTAHVLPNASNTTTTPTFNLCSTGALTVVKAISGALVAVGANDYTTGVIATFLYTGTYWQLQNPQNNTGLTTPVAVSLGGTGTGSTLAGLMRGNSSAMTAAELSGDATTSGSNAVTVAKINGVAVTGTPSVGYVPTATSSTAATWQAAAGGGGALVLLEEHTASSSANLQFTTCLSATYDDYIVKGVSIVPGTDTVSLIMQYSTNGGSSYDSTSGHYRWGYVYVGDSGAASTVNSASDSSITIGGGFTTFTASSGDFSIELFNPLGTTTRLKTTEDVALDNGSGAGLPYRYAGFSQYNITPAAVNAFQVLFSSGNIASGTIRCYGLTH